MAAQSPDGIRTFRNPGAAAVTEPYPLVYAAILNDAGFTAAFDEIRGWPGYAATPLQRLPGLAPRREGPVSTLHAASRSIRQGGHTSRPLRVFVGHP